MGKEANLAALAANKANAQKAGRPKGKISLSDISFRDRCRVRDEEHIATLEHIARYSENEAFRLAAIRDLFDRGRGRGGTTSFGSYVGLQFDRNVGVIVLSNETNVGLPDAIGAWTFDRLEFRKDGPPARRRCAVAGNKGKRRQTKARSLGWRYIHG